MGSFVVKRQHSGILHINSLEGPGGGGVRSGIQKRESWWSAFIQIPFAGVHNLFYTNKYR